MDALMQFYDELFTELRTRGVKLPWLVVTVAINGSSLVMRMTDDGADGMDTETLTERYFDQGMMKLPINIMVIDATGEAVRALITTEGMTFH